MDARAEIQRPDDSPEAEEPNQDAIGPEVPVKLHYRADAHARSGGKLQPRQLRDQIPAARFRLVWPDEARNHSQEGILNGGTVQVVVSTLKIYHSRPNQGRLIEAAVDIAELDRILWIEYID